MPNSRQLLPLTRREFLRRLTVLSGAAASASVFPALAAAPNPRRPLRVIIAGAGLAGLCAAYELERRGHSVTILEADRKHVGGRVRTLRFGDGLYGEAGAMRIPTRHAITRRYISEFDLPLRKFVHSNPQAYYYVRGERQRIANVKALTNRRFWESDDGIFGGGTFTDMPTGTTYYPANNAETKDPRISAGPGVLLASYSWGQAARRLASLPHKDRAAVVLHHLSRVHPQLRQTGVVRHTASWSWDNHPYSGGAFAWFMPGQHSELHRHIIAPEGRIYFAGEHASLTHTWMQGALESGLRAVREMIEAAQTA